MKELTKELCQSAVATLENVYLDSKDTEPMTVKEAVEYCYEYFIQLSETDYEFDRSVRFDGKIPVIKEIERLINESNDIKLKN